jgi:hypothetical protein
LVLDFETSGNAEGFKLFLSTPVKNRYTQKWKVDGGIILLIFWKLVIFSLISDFVSLFEFPLRENSKREENKRKEEGGTRGEGRG